MLACAPLAAPITPRLVESPGSDYYFWSRATSLALSDHSQSAGRLLRLALYSCSHFACGRSWERSLSSSLRRGCFGSPGFERATSDARMEEAKPDLAQDTAIRPQAKVGDATKHRGPCSKQEDALERALIPDANGMFDASNAQAKYNRCLSAAERRAHRRAQSDPR